MIGNRFSWHRRRRAHQFFSGWPRRHYRQQQQQPQQQYRWRQQQKRRRGNDDSSTAIDVPEDVGAAISPDGAVVRGVATTSKPLTQEKEPEPDNNLVVVDDNTGVDGTEEEEKDEKNAAGEGDEVIKLARVEDRGGVPHYKVYWAVGRPTEEPLDHLDGVDREFIDKADAARGEDVLLTGARKHRSSCVGSSRKGLTSRVTAFLIQAPQYCVLNSLRNLLGRDDDTLLPETCVAAIEALGPSISVTDLVAASTLGRSAALRLPFMLQRVKDVEDVALLDHLSRQTTGKFLLLTVHGRHCIAVDADRGLVMESDPAFPQPQPLSLAGFRALQVENVHSCRRVVRKKASRKRKRPRAPA